MYMIFLLFLFFFLFLAINWTKLLGLLNIPTASLQRDRTPNECPSNDTK